MTINTAPQSLLDLATAAIERGFDHVRLGFGGLGSDFPAPISWMLHLHRRPWRDGEGIEFLMIEMQADDDAPAAYVGSHFPDRADPYWQAEEILGWIREDTDLITAPEGELRERLGPLLPIVLGAYANGWAVSVDVKTRDAMWQDEASRRHGLDPLDAPPSVTVDLEALNYFYNVDGHPSHRDTGAPVSIRHGLLVHRTGERVSHHVTEVPLFTAGATAFEPVVERPADWFVPVASYDEDHGGWVLPAEATAWKELV